MIEAFLSNHLQYLFLQYIVASFMNNYLGGIKKDKIYFISTGIFSLVLSFIYIEIDLITTGFLWLFLVYLTYSYLHRVDSAIMLPSITLLLYIFSNYLTVFVLEPFSSSFVQSYWFIFIITCLIYAVLGVGLKKGKDILLKRMEVSNVLRWAAAILSLLTFVSYFVIITIERFQGYLSSMGKANTIFVIGYGVVSAVVFLMLIYSNQKENLVKQRQQEMSFLKEYTDQLEKNNNEMRRFKHDYQNILLSLEEYISEKDLPGLEKYFFENIKDTSKNMESNSFKLSQLSNLEVRELKSLFANKLLFSQEKGINTEIEISEKIETINTNPLSLVRALGIILDNAIEAAEAIPDGILRAAIFQKDGSTVIIIANSCSPDIPKLFMLKKEGFSTKGENRGLGLSNLERIVADEKNMTLDTKIENGLFSQILSIGG